MYFVGPDLSTAREYSYMVTVRVLSAEVSDQVFNRKQLIEAGFFIKDVRYHHLLAISLNSMSRVDIEDCVLFVGVLLEALPEGHVHLETYRLWCVAEFEDLLRLSEVELLEHIFHDVAVFVAAREVFDRLDGHDELSRLEALHVILVLLKLDQVLKFHTLFVAE